jgi:ATP-dependent exoDNAse (exonuclease V) alpha subunit|mmetsp:Transcript_4311/g.6968  ORF Transcript_4311/g.6968 Transcript_4311/m.6968 type:complete len:130 (+) Transcript_4311:440-829(+)
MDNDLSFSLSSTIPNLVPIVPVTDSRALMGKYLRTQLPLQPAFASTVHKAQGVTAKYGIVFSPSPSENSSMAMGLEYVALSRAKCLADILLLAPIRTTHFTSHANMRDSIRSEYARLHSTHTVPPLHSL